MESEDRKPPVIPLHGTRSGSGYFIAAGYVFIFLAAVIGSHFLLTRLGTEIFVFALAGLTMGLVYALVSFRSLAFPFYVMILSVGALRYIWAVKAPILPDLYFDRISLIWMSVVFAIVYFATRKKLVGPWALDLFILAHGAYILLRVFMNDMKYFHVYTMSILTPYMVYYFAKNVIRTRKQMHNLMWVLLGLSVYYTITSIAEKYEIHWLLYPRYMIEKHPEFHGRSNGPFRNPGVFGNAIGMLLPVHLYFIAVAKRNWVKILMALSMVMGFAALFFSYTRGSWLAGVAGLAAVAFFNRRYYLRTLVPLVVLVPFFALYFLGVGQDKFMQERVENQDTIDARVGTMVMVLRVWRAFPVLGCGSYDFHHYRDDYLAPIDVPILGTIRTSQFRNTPAHDQYLGPLAEDGLVGAFLQFAIYILIIKVMLEKYGLRKRQDYFAIFILPIFLGIAANYLVGGLTISYRHFSIMGVLFYMAAGITYGYEPDEGDETMISAQQSGPER